ncbi:MAG: lytic murein transglycosylase [Actinomycetota bacterium]|nr:lytic murein transglycosylase [Actinomycetota bacterium]
MHGRRTRAAVALIGLLVALGVPAAMLGRPVPTVDGRPNGSLADPAGLGVTGALPGDPLTAEPTPSAEATTVPGGVPSDATSVGLSGIPTPPNLLDGPLGIPGVVLDAYQFAQHTLAETRPGCHLLWSVLAGIGRIESDHASDGRVDAFGNTLGPILGPKLDGSPGVAAIPDTDHGVLDGDAQWDRAVGPMQFIPSSWRLYGVDGNGDGVGNPNNIYDSTVATGLYLCAGGSNLSDPAQLQAAVFRYNHSAAYVDVVLEWARAYLTGVVPTLSAPGLVPPGTSGNGGLSTVPEQAQPPAAPPASAAQVAALAPSAPPAPPVMITTPSPAPPSPTTTTTPTATPSPDTVSTSPSPEPSATMAPPTTSSEPIPSPSPLPVTTTTSNSPGPVPTPSPTSSPSLLSSTAH